MLSMFEVSDVIAILGIKVCFEAAAANMQHEPLNNSGVSLGCLFPGKELPPPPSTIKVAVIQKEAV